MNTLVGLGAGAAFGVSCVAAGLPALGWRTFFEEPAMLLGFVLVGRALEERAKLQASSDLIELQVRAEAAASLACHGLLGACMVDSCQCFEIPTCIRWRWVACTTRG